MEVSSKLINSANATAAAQINSEMISKRVDELAKKAAKQVKIDGFRPGKAPIAVVKQRYSKELEGDAKQEIFKSIIDEALKNVGKKVEDVLGEPIFSKYEDKDGVIDVELEISFRPEVKVDGYEEIIPEFSTPRVTKKEIESKIGEFLKMIAPLEKVEKESLESGDFAKFDFEGFVDGVAFDGGKAEDYLLEIGSNQFIPGFEDGMIGVKVGETRDVNVKFPAEYGAENLAGKDAVFKVKLNEIQAKKVAQDLDEESLAKFMPGEENPTKEKFEARIKEEIRNEKFSKLINEELKPKFADALAEKFNFDLPKTIVEQEIDLQFRNSWSNFTSEEMEKFRNDKDALTNKREEFRAEAQKSVKITFLIAELAKVKSLNVSDQELVQAVYFEAYRYGIDPKKHLEDYRNNGVLPALKMALLEDKVFNSIFSLGKDDKEEDK